MSKTGRYNYRRPAKGRNQPEQPRHHITVRGVRKDPPDYQKLSRAVIALELEELDLSKPLPKDILDLPGNDESAGNATEQDKRSADAAASSPAPASNTDGDHREADHDA